MAQVLISSELKSCLNPSIQAFSEARTKHTPYPEIFGLEWGLSKNITWSWRMVWKRDQKRKMKASNKDDDQGAKRVKKKERETSELKPRLSSFQHRGGPCIRSLICSVHRAAKRATGKSIVNRSIPAELHHHWTRWRHHLPWLSF